MVEWETGEWCAHAPPEPPADARGRRRDAQIRVHCVPEDAARVWEEENVTGLLRETRVDAVGEVLLTGGRSFKEVIVSSSAGADLVILGVAEPGADFTSCYGPLQNLADGLGTVVFVLAAQDLPFKEILH